jgi:hypothetical protein
MTPHGSNRLATKIANLATQLLPPNLKQWGKAMRSEIDAISAPKDATIFAIGCAFFALRQRISFASDRVFNHLVEHPSQTVAICAILATALGLVYMSLAKAPISLLAMNGGALVMGFLIVGIATMSAKIFTPRWGPLSLVLASVIMLTSLFGSSAEGATRWIMLRGISVQTSLLLVPIIAMVFARHQNVLTTLATILTSLALALQPDRGMSGALAAGMLALALSKPTKFGVIAAIAAMCGFVVAMMQPDTLPAAHYVDQVYFSSFAVHPIAGLAVLVGTILLFAPAIICWLGGGAERDMYLVFGAVWGAMCLAAAFGNYPTPIVGYGGSAIIGYVVCMLGFAKPLKRATLVAQIASHRDGPREQTPDIRTVLA